MSASATWAFIVACVIACVAVSVFITLLIDHIQRREESQWRASLPVYRSPPDVDTLARLAVEFATAPDDSFKVARAVELFGRDGLDYIPLLNCGPLEIRRIWHLANKDPHTWRRMIRDVVGHGGPITRPEAP